MSIAYRPVNLLAAVTAAGPSAVYPLDYRFESIQKRNLIVACVAGDSILVEVSADGGGSWGTLTTLAGPQASTVYSIDGPYTALRVTKVGATGAATVKGIL